MRKDKDRQGLEIRIRDVEERLAAIETLLESGGARLADYRREPKGWEDVFRMIKALQVERLEKDIPNILRLLGPDPTEEETDRHARDLAEKWETTDHNKYRGLYAVTKQDLMDRFNVSDKTLKKRTDYLLARGLILRWPPTGGTPQDSKVRFALPPRNFIGLLRAWFRGTHPSP